MSEDNRRLPVAEFFESREGPNAEAIGLLVQFDRLDGNIKSELLERLDASGDTVGNFIQKAQAADLITEAKRDPNDHGRSTRYKLTTRGEAIQGLLRERGLNETYQRYLTAKTELDTSIPNIQETIEFQGLISRISVKLIYVVL